jgi:hypothetical protein
MDKKFKETNILEDYSKILAKNCITLGPSITPMVATTLFDGVSRCLGAIKSETTPKAVIFRSMDHSFIAGAKVTYIAGDDPTSSRWDYVWTFYEKDLEGADIIDASSNSMILTYFESSGINLYKMKFAGADTCATMMALLVEMIKKWLTENAVEGETTSLELEGAFKAIVTKKGDEVEYGLIPDGEMKRLIKDDTALSD